MESFFAGVTQRWPAGREDYHWHILSPEQQTRTALWEPCREMTHREGLVPVEPAWYHVAVLHSAPDRVMPPGSPQEPCDRAVQRCWSARVDVMPVASHPSKGGRTAELVE